MKKCVKCGKKGLFLNLNAQKQCTSCSFISILETEIATISKQIVAVENQVATISKQVATVENQVATISEQVGTAENKVTAVEQAVKQLEQKITYVEKSIQLNMKNWVVENKYRTARLQGYQFEWNGCLYSIENAPQKLIIRAVNGDFYGIIKVGSYCDCGILIGDVFFCGERFGKINGYNMLDKKMCFCSYINEEAKKFYEDQASLYPFTFPPTSGSYDCLPEINLANYIVSKLSVTTQASYRHYLIAGDLSGHVSVFDVNTLQLVKTFTVDGAVAGIKMDGNKMVIDYVQSDNLSSPESLHYYTEALQTYIEISL